MAAGRGERRCCCSVAWEPSESESSSDGRRIEGVTGGGEEGGIVVAALCETASVAFATAVWLLQGQGIEAVAEEKVYGWRSEYTGIREEGRKNMLLVVFPHGLHEEA